MWVMHSKNNNIHPQSGAAKNYQSAAISWIAERLNSIIEKLKTVVRLSSLIIRGGVDILCVYKSQRV